MSRRILKDVGAGRTAESFDTYGHNAPKPYDPFTVRQDGSSGPVPHEDIDTDDLRKQENRWRHSSYKK